MVDNVKKGDYTHVFAGHSAFGKNLMPRIAALLDTQGVSDIVSVESEDSTCIGYFEAESLLTARKHSSVPSTPVTS